MNAGHIERPGTYQLISLSQPFPAILLHLGRLRPHKLPGQYPIEECDLTYDVCCDDPPAIAAAPIVSHRNNAVVKVCLSGTAWVDVWSNLAPLEVAHEYQQPKDEVGWLSSRATTPLRVVLEQGAFVIIAPHEAYRLGVRREGQPLTVATLRVPRALFDPSYRPLRQRHLAETSILCEL